MSILYLRDAAGNIVPVTTIQGVPGDKGATFTPSVSDGVLSWSNDGDLENPPDFDFASSLPAGIQPPETAEVGQTIVVKAVDENGKPTEWEAAYLPSDGNNSEREWELFKEITIEEEAHFTIGGTSESELGNKQYKELFIGLTFIQPASTTAHMAVAVNNHGGGQGTKLANVLNTSATSYLYIHIEPVTSGYYKVSAGEAGAYATRHFLAYTKHDEANYGKSNFIKYFAITTKFGVGSNITIYGR